MRGDLLASIENAGLDEESLGFIDELLDNFVAGKEEYSPELTARLASQPPAKKIQLSKLSAFC